MLSLVLLLTAAQIKPPEVAAPDLSVVGLDANRGALYAEHFAQQLTTVGFSVVTQKQIGALLGQERQKQLLGCSDASSSCMAELASALGSDAIITGSVARLGAGYQVNISIISAKDGKPLSVLSSRESSEEGVLDVMTREAPRMAQEAYTRLRPGHGFHPAREGIRRYALIPAVVAVALLATSVGLVLASWGIDDQLAGRGSGSTSHFSLTQAQGMASTGQSLQIIGYACGAVAIAAAVAAIALVVFGAERPAELSFGPTSSSSGLAWRFP